MSRHTMEFPRFVYRTISGVCPRCGWTNALRTPCWRDAPDTITCATCGTRHPITLQPEESNADQSPRREHRRHP